MHPPAFLEGLRPTLHIAHRGGAALAPENTMPAFRQACERFRTDMLELDVHLSKDGVLVVSHDDTVDRCTDGQGRIRDLTWQELSSLDAGHRFTPDGGNTFPFRGQGVRLPRLEEVLRAFPLRLNIELKQGPEGSEQAFAKLLRELGAVSRVCIGSEDDAVGLRLFEAIPDACHFYPRDVLTAYVMSLRMGEPTVVDDRFWVLDMPLFFEGFRLIDAEFLSKVRSHGRWVNVWTIDDPAEMRQLLNEGVGGIMTDRPDLLRVELDRERK